MAVPCKAVNNDEFNNLGLSLLFWSTEGYPINETSHAKAPSYCSGTRELGILTMSEVVIPHLSILKKLCFRHAPDPFHEHE